MIATRRARKRFRIRVWRLGARTVRVAISTFALVAMGAMGSLGAQTVQLTNATLFRTDATGTNLASSGGIVNHGGWTTVLDQQNVPGNFFGELFLTAIANPGEGNFLSPSASLAVALPPGVHTFYFWADGDDLVGGTAAFGMNLYFNGAGTQTPSISAFVAPAAGSTFNPDGSTTCTAGFNGQCVRGSAQLGLAVGNTIVTLTDFKILGVGGAPTNNNCQDLVDSTNLGPFAFPAHPDGICDTYGQFTLTVSNGALPDLVFGDIWTTGILAINTANQSANYEANFFGDSGASVPLPFGGVPGDTLSGTLAPLGSAYSEASAPQSAFAQGWGKVAADPSIVLHALFRDHQPNGAYYEAAVPSNPGAKEFLAPFDYTTLVTNQQPITTGLAIANLEPVQATVLCTARDASGVGIPNAVQIPLLNPQAHWTGFTFPLLVGLRGTLDCTSNTNIAALAVRYFGTATFSSLPVVNNPASTNSNPVVALPDLVAGDIWTTGFFVINTAPQAANYRINIIGDSGAPLPLKFASGLASVVSGTLPANGSVYFEASDPASPVQQGWGQVVADPSIVVHALFRDQRPDGNSYEAAVPSNPGGSKEFLAPFDYTTDAASQLQLTTGFAIANLDPQTAIVTCTARDSGGNVIPNAVQVPALNPLGHWSGFNFPALSGRRGTVDCTSNTNIAALAVRYFGPSTFSTLPVIPK
ncbi:MAG TPA: hypothetical protein VGR73_21635 [Bryobacteraceae bacterium]|nr:hypothetical protein [Bryobacteraceae bacterium]